MRARAGASALAAMYVIKRPAQGRSGTSQIRKVLAPAGLAFGPTDAHEGHQARSEKRESRSFQIIFTSARERIPDFRRVGAFGVVPERP